MMGGGKERESEREEDDRCCGTNLPHPVTNAQIWKVVQTDTRGGEILEPALLDRVPYSFGRKRHANFFLPLQLGPNASVCRLFERKAYINPQRTVPHPRIQPHSAHHPCAPPRRNEKKGGRIDSRPEIDVWVRPRADRQVDLVVRNASALPAAINLSLFLFLSFSPLFLATLLFRLVYILGLSPRTARGRDTPSILARIAPTRHHIRWETAFIPPSLSLLELELGDNATSLERPLPLWMGSL